MNLRRTSLAATLLLALVGSACSSDSATDAGSSATTQVAGRGWIDGEPDWSGGEMAAGGAAMDSAATGSAAPAASTIAEGDSFDDDRGRSASGPLLAGSVDDNERFAEYLDYLSRVGSLGFPIRPFDPTGRIVVHVTGDDGRPVAGAEVHISAGGTDVAVQRTDTTGRTIFLPHGRGDVADSYTIEVEGASVDAAPGDEVDLDLDRPGGAADGVPVDVLFLLDVTGSMGDEVEQLKETIATVADQLSALPVAPDIRFAMTLYRDEGDAFVTSTFDFTDDIGAFEAALADVQAGGGGDTPEALDEALAAALDEPAWRDPATTEQFVFLVADAAPHVERQVTPYTETMLRAAERGITVHSIAASSTDDPAEYALRAIAQATGGRFVFLAYGAGGAATGANTDIDPTDYETLSLDALVVRLVGEALGTLTGTEFAPPSQSTSTTQSPDQQQGD